MLQLELRNTFSDVAKILVPSEAGLTILKGQRPLLSLLLLFYQTCLAYSWDCL